jgi:hypothetical protein
MFAFVCGPGPFAATAATASCAPLHAVGGPGLGVGAGEVVEAVDDATVKLRLFASSSVREATG